MVTVSTRIDFQMRHEFMKKVYWNFSIDSLMSTLYCSIPGVY